MGVLWEHHQPRLASTMPQHAPNNQPGVSRKCTIFIESEENCLSIVGSQNSSHCGAWWGCSCLAGDRLSQEGGLLGRVPELDEGRTPPRSNTHPNLPSVFSEL